MLEKKKMELANNSHRFTENNINVYDLVIQKATGEPRTFRIKNDACSSFGWPRVNSFAVMSGIIEH
jgi:hypothetical protein